MKFTFLTISFGLLFISCTKKYKYVERIQSSKDKKIKFEHSFFYSKNDQSAYLEAYSKFKASTNVSDFSKQRMQDDYNNIIDFQVFDNNDKNITYVEFDCKKDSENEIEKKFKRRDSKSGSKPLSEIDIEELREKFVIQNVDRNTRFYSPKRIQERQQPLFYLYIREKNGFIDGLRMRFTRKRNEYSFAREAKFYTKNGSHTIFFTSSLSKLNNSIEGFDEDLLNNKDLLRDLLETDNLKIKILGSYGITDELIHAEELEDVKKIINIFLQYS
ncbi:hypothetical protein NAL32_21690 [Chryseobacterium sp. Ch-15]|uniref:Lipoprotein n=1 Tax=Chryseobacterium muglaense TaxID=2893752 RepID=A0A9Q3UWN2_9FLAO|nr:hypothetical protein [Chryseobacterium muglaense]MBD3907307.1 hypothetical protein [Chryseobacterium muglaense]MCC9034355.1 hypothetical protein [Chryseobacterium muglaense]MCM2557003.1 hypothetical protein [Chryseobacterium muglaense]